MTGISHGLFSEDVANVPNLPADAVSIMYLRYFHLFFLHCTGMPIDSGTEETDHLQNAVSCFSGFSLQW